MSNQSQLTRVLSPGMKASLSLAVALFVNLVYCSQRASATAGGSFDFLSPTFTGTVPKGDDTFSDPITTNRAFKFGDGTVQSVYVSTNGYISMGITPTVNAANSGPNSVVAPYGADIDTSIAGTIRYTPVISSGSEIERVSRFIEEKIDLEGLSGDAFTGTRMIVVSWDRVAQYNGNESVTSTFQCVLITDDYTSYAVFIYECGGMGWGGATIGWQASRQHASVHELNGEKSNEIGCKYSSTYSAVVFRLHDCGGGAVSCDGVKCVPPKHVCDGKEDCSDKRDEEQNCPNTILYIGAGFGAIFFLFLVLFLLVCGMMLCHYKGKKQARNLAHDEVDTTMPVAATNIDFREDDSKPETPPVSQGVTSNHYETSCNGQGIYPHLQKEKEVEFKSISNGYLPTYTACTTFPSVNGLQGYPPPTYPVQPAVSSQNHTEMSTPPMITEDTV